jgi:hypothetical protein
VGKVAATLRRCFVIRLGNSIAGKFCKGGIMSGKTGKKPTGRKPDSVRRQSSRAVGAFGKETGQQVVTRDTNRNIDKGGRKSRTGGAAGGA